MSRPEEFIYPTGTRTPLALTDEAIRTAGREVYNLHVISVNLSRIYRYAACSGITVLDHSMALSLYFDFSPRMSLLALMHDAAEAYLGDISLPMKKFMKQEYFDLLSMCQVRIEGFMLPFEPIHLEEQAVHKYDKACVLAEIEHERGLNIVYPPAGKMSSSLAAREFQEVAKARKLYDRAYSPCEFLVRYQQLIHKINHAA